MPQTTNLLMRGANAIRTQLSQNVTAIQFEDGSGWKFNYQIDGGNWQFIDLGKEWYDGIEVKLERLRVAIQLKNDRDFIQALKGVLATFSRRLALEDFEVAIKLARHQGKDDILDELFNGGE